MAFNLDSVKGRRNWAIATLGSIGAIYLANKARKGSQPVSTPCVTVLLRVTDI